MVFVEFGFKASLSEENELTTEVVVRVAAISRDEALAQAERFLLSHDRKFALVTERDITTEFRSVVVDAW